MSDQNPVELPTVTVSQYTINPLPVEARVADWWHWNVYARLNRVGRWVVTDLDCFYDSAGGRHFTAREAGDYTEAEAIAIATRVAATRTLMGETHAQAAARIRGAS
jgi:hypothetical protein